MHDPRLSSVKEKTHGYEVLTVAAYPCPFDRAVKQVLSVLQAEHDVELLQIVTVVVMFATVSVPAEALIWFRVSV